MVFDILTPFKVFVHKLINDIASKYFIFDKVFIITFL